MPETPVPTADLVDQYGTELRVCETQFRQFGGCRAFTGPVRTVSCHEDNGLLRELVRAPGSGCVLVVDGGGSLRAALVGDMLSGLRSAGATIVLVEQDLRRAMDACDDLVCLLEGRVALAAPVADVTRDQVVAAYFGEGAP